MRLEHLYQHKLVVIKIRPAAVPVKNEQAKQTLGAVKVDIAVYGVNSVVWKKVVLPVFCF